MKYGYERFRSRPIDRLFSAIAVLLLVISPADTGTIQAVYATICPNDTLVKTAIGSQWKAAFRAFSKCAH